MAKSDKSAGIASDSAAGIQAPQIAGQAAASASDRYDDLLKKLAQLDAMLRMTYGASGDNFRDNTVDAQDDYLWACNDMATACSALAESLSSMIYGQSEHLQ